jgi:acetyl-CoA carboxylase carboxyltransferase component
MIQEIKPFISKINPLSPRYQENYAKMQELSAKLAQEMAKTLFQGDPKSIQRAKKYNRLLATERIELLLDQDSPFLELLPLAGWGTDCYRVGSSVIAGIGIVQEKLCMIISHVGTVKGGAVDSVTLQKMLRINEIAAENNLIVVNLLESAGANLMEQAKLFNYAGAVYREITRRSKNGTATITIIFGNCAAGGAYVPAVSDYVIMIKDSSRVFLAGPALVKLATGEVTDEESLGGAAMHNRVSGVSDYLAENEEDGIRIAREIVYYLQEPPPLFTPAAEVDTPLYPAEELLGIISADVKIPFDAREVIARIVDGSRFSEFKAEFGITLVTGFAEIHGYKVGFIANNGVLFADAANKAAHFIQLCNQNSTPVIFLQNITGFIVGKEYEEDGIIKHGSKMLNAVANSEVPLITIITGASYGAGNFAMCGRSLQPGFLFCYPNSKIAVMGPEQLHGVLGMIAADSGENSRDYLLAETERQSSPFFATGQLWNDAIIDPRETRDYLGICLAAVNRGKAEKNKSYGIFRM